nr:metallo beta lactamase domain containing protein [Hymenolepis microstoma]
MTGSDLSSAACTITLIYGQFNILFDPGCPWDGNLVKSILAEHNLNSQDINYVICSHGHVDHVGNLHDFPNATIIVGTDILNGGMFRRIQISSSNPFIVDSNARVIFTPGHTQHDVSLVVQNVPKLGTVVVSGDIFENQHDRTDEKLWRDVSIRPDLQEKSRNLILSLADYIIPGHGPMFKI